MLDGVRYASNFPSVSQYGFEHQPFALVSIHRFENIFTSRFTKVILPVLKNIAQTQLLVFVLHPTTRERIHSLGLEEELTSNSNIILHERFSFVEWIRLCARAKFVITDGGSNQEELSYLGVPTLLFRKETERHEGIGSNVVISNFDEKIITDFIEKLDLYRTNVLYDDANPSKKIISTIRELAQD